MLKADAFKNYDALRGLRSCADVRTKLSEAEFKNHPEPVPCESRLYLVGCSYFPDRKGSVPRVSLFYIINLILRARYVPRVITFPFRRAAVTVQIEIHLTAGSKTKIKMLLPNSTLGQI